MEHKHTFRIRGMDCAEETHSLKGTVSRLPGVTDLHFNLLKGLMQVTCSGEAPSEDAAALEAESEHPLARAILRRAEKEGVPVKKAERFQAIKGKGAEGWI